MSNANLPANIANMATGLAQSVQTVGAAGGAMFIKMVGGVWTFGAEDIEVEEDSLWIIHPASFEHGWVAWGDKEHGTEGKNLGEKMGPAAQPLFPESELPEVEGAWSKCIAFRMACINGEDEGTQVIYKANSFGARRAYGDVLEAVVEKLVAGDAACAPVVKLEATSYKHKTYGKTWNPVISIQEWRTLDDVTPVGDAEAQEDTEEEPEGAPPACRRRGKVVKPESEPAKGELVGGEEEEEPEPPRRRRRRRAA